MEAAIVYETFSFEKELAVKHAQRVYDCIKIETKISIDFNDFFNGIAKKADSVTGAAHDAVIYHCYKTLDKKVSANDVAALFQISLEQLLNIIWYHNQKIETSIYYRSYSKKLSGNNDIAFPGTVYIKIPKNHLPIKKYLEIVADMVFEEIYEKTQISKREIIQKSRKSDIVCCRTVFINILLAIAKDAPQKLIYTPVNVDHSMMSFYRNSHRENIEASFKGYVEEKVRKYVDLYNHIALRMDKRLNNKK